MVENKWKQLKPEQPATNAFYIRKKIRIPPPNNFTTQCDGPINPFGTFNVTVIESIIAMIKRIIKATELNEDERCAKHEAVLASRLAKEVPDEVSSSDEIPKKEDDDEAKLPFEDILADKRRRYTAKQEFVYFLYSALLEKFLKEREGTYLRKIALSNEEDTEESRDEDVEKDDAPFGKEEITITTPMKLYVPDENVKMTFVNENSYSGRISRQKMEGHGVYCWHNGSQYKGEFEDNQIQRNGTLEWQDGCWYEGYFKDGYRNGKGTMVNRENIFTYVGQWRKGHAHGKGFCRYEKGDSYDGDWIMGKREGLGNRVYPSGARYVGHWKEGLRHGVGTMVWPNGDVYRGEWNKGEMQGYGEYTWNGFFNRGLCWPQEESYMGGWQNGTRHGRGQLSLNSIGGARYTGEWRENKKHGYGTIIGNNGEEITGDPLFENNILLPVPSTKNLLHLKNTRDVNKIDCRDSHEVVKPAKIAEGRFTTVLKPEQLPCISYYIDRLRETETATTFSLVSTISAKYRVCEDKSSCPGLGQFRKKEMPDKATRSLSNSSSSKIKCETPSSSFSQDSFAHEERGTYDCIAMHMPRIRNVYNVYSKIFCREPPKCRMSMNKLSLWQLWRDCRIDKKAGMSLVQIDHCLEPQSRVDISLAVNKFTLTEDPYCPFGKIEIWQLIHALLEVSWHIYTKNGDLDAGNCPSKLANGLNKFLLEDIYPNFGKSAGILTGPERDLLPLYPVYQLYLSVGKPHSARQLLKAIFAKTGNNVNPVLCQPVAEFFPNGTNSVTVGEKLSYLISDDEALVHAKLHSKIQRSKNSRAHSLFALQGLGTEEFINIMSVICPAINDSETGVIVNMDYQLTFLEFHEIFVEAGKQLTSNKIMKLEADRAKAAEIAETALTVNSTKERKISHSISRLSSAGKSTRSRKKIVSRS